MNNKKCIGILGGMGPDATFLLCRKILKKTSVKTDQEHIELIIHSNTKIPDRTQAILYGGESPLNELVRSAHILECSGVDLIIMPCMTAHYYYTEVIKEIKIPFLNAIDETTINIKESYPGIKEIGILATTGTIKSNLFQNSLHQSGFNTLILPEDQQELLVMDAIYSEKGIKSGNETGYANSKLTEAGNYLINQGAQLIITGCTEIPIVVGQKDLACPMVDPMEVLAKKAVMFVLDL